VHDALERWGVLAQLRDDDAGRQALAALGIDPPLAAARARRSATASSR
jgi:hypothetical protein